MSVQEYHDKNSRIQKLSDRDLIELRKNKRLFQVKNIKMITEWGNYIIILTRSMKGVV